jgi:hypothetical protein
MTFPVQRKALQLKAHFFDALFTQANNVFSFCTKEFFILSQLFQAAKVNLGRRHSQKVRATRQHFSDDIISENSHHPVRNVHCHRSSVFRLGDYL